MDTRSDHEKATVISELSKKIEGMELLIAVFYRYDFAIINDNERGVILSESINGEMQFEEPMFYIHKPNNLGNVMLTYNRRIKEIMAEEKTMNSRKAKSLDN